jgi:hypothetical protein
MTIEQLDEETENFTTIIQIAAWSNTPVLRRKVIGNNYPKGIRELTVERDAGNRQQHLLIKQD